MRISQLIRPASLSLGVLALVLLAPSSKADTTYTYTGNDFNSFGGGGACPPQCDMTISFTLATALGGDANEVGADPLSFAVSDGLTTITQATALSSSFGFFSTDASGNIIGWNIDAISALYGMFSGTGPAGCAGCTVLDASFLQSDTIDMFALIKNDPGKWTVSSNVPEPSGALMLGMGVLTLLGLRLKKASV
jgi:hypothetical protein